MFRHTVVTEVAPPPFRGERSSRKVWREALEAEKLEERLPRPALAVDKQVFERDRVHARVALRDAELPREAIPHALDGMQSKTLSFRLPVVHFCGFPGSTNQQK